MAVEGREQVTRIGAVRVNGRPEELDGPDGRRQPPLGGTSRVSREAQARICERLGVKFPGATRPDGYQFALLPREPDRAAVTLTCWRPGDRLKRVVSAEPHRPSGLDAPFASARCHPRGRPRCAAHRRTHATCRRIATALSVGVPAWRSGSKGGSLEPISAAVKVPVCA